MLMESGNFGPEGPKMKYWVAWLRYGASLYSLLQGLLLGVVVWNDPRTNLQDVPSTVTLYGIATMFVCWGTYWFIRTMRYRPGVFMDEWSISNKGYEKVLRLLIWLSTLITMITISAFLMRWL